MINYSILINNNGSWQYIYKAGTDAMVTGAKLNLALNDAGYLEFTVPPTNALQDMLFERQTKVQVQKNDKEYWYGYVLDTEENSRKELKVYCVGELSYLNDTIQPQARYQHQTPLQLFTAYLNQHNAQSDEQFVVGQVTVEDSNDDVYRFTNLESTLTALREDLCESLQGYLRIRRVNGIRYLDLVKISDYGPQAEQPIQFGYNLLDYTCNVTASDIATACRPKGARLETQEIEGLDSYVDITSVNGGVDFVQDSTAVANFGMIKKVVSWDNVNDPQILKDKAEAWLSENQYSMMTLKLSAIDMAVLVSASGTWKEFDRKTWADLLSMTWEQLASGEQQVKSFELGDRVRAIADPYGMNARFPIYSVSIDLQDYSKTVYTLSNTQPSKSYTQMASSNVSAVEKNIADTSSFLNQFIRNQTDIINNTEGYYTIQKNDHAMTGWTIADNESPELAENLIKATLGGIGISEDGGQTYKTAITGKGINADTITTGTLKAINIKGSTLEVITTRRELKSSYSNTDAQNVLQYLAGTKTLTKSQMEKYDFNLDGALGTGDATLISRFVNGDYGSYIDYTTTFLINPTSGIVAEIEGISENGVYNFSSQGTTLRGSGGCFGKNGNTLIGDEINTSSIFCTGDINCNTLTQRSLAEIKKNIKPFKNGLEEVNKTDIYEFNYKTEEDGKHKHIGFVIGENYNLTDKIINGSGIDTYTAIGVLWEAVKELSARVNELERGEH